ncbi:MFS transporter [Anaerobiospirillum sp. NML120448]|uniref:MFS transporter n=1 Tax=Anaerobiospirillum sp. NML120448 TaxID=2932816 RepID=UPI001FF2F309|nr:MFS transporter [Anaerobiospirillum sp. NML120448]MCK0513339.1 MFS transporter [Anaerobiospirillum sp. NML120448]
MSQTARLLLVIGLFWFTQYVYVPYTTPFLLAQKVSADFVGLVVGFYGAIPFFTRLFVGIFSDKIGYYKPMIIVGCASAAVASIIRLYLPTGMGFLIANIISGFSSSMWMCFILFHTKTLTKENLQKGMGYVLAACNGGILLGFFASATLYEHFGMFLMCLLSVSGGTISTIISLSLKEPPNNNINPPKVSELLHVAYNKRLWFFSVIGMIQQGILMGTAMSFSNEVAHSLGASAWQIGIMTMTMTASYTASNLLSSTHTAIKIGPGILMTLSQICMALYCVLMVTVDSVYALIPIQILLGTTGGFVFSWCSAEALSQIESYRRSTALGIFQSMFAIGMTAVPIVAGYLFAQTSSLNSAFFFQALLAIAGALATAIYYARRRHHKRTAK